MDYLLDTNVIIIYSKSVDLAAKIEHDLQLFKPSNNLSISIISIAEVNSIIHQFQIGDRRRTKIDGILANITKLDISYEEILKRYEEIDAYSQGKHRTLRSDFSAINMGKNDIWIAATASAFDITLVSSDKDFQHLAGVFLKLKYIDLATYQKE